MEHTTQNSLESSGHLKRPDFKLPSPCVSDGNSIEMTEQTSEPREIEEIQHLTGIKLVMLVSAVTLVNFLTLLDLTIIVTVSVIHELLGYFINILGRLFHLLLPNFTP
jgi:hypothetical protein